jgi:hypothetical protein
LLINPLKMAKLKHLAITEQTKIAMKKKLKAD